MTNPWERSGILCNTHELEWHHVILAVGGAHQPEIERVALLQLKVLDGFLRYQSRLGRPSQPVERRSFRAAEIGIRQTGCVFDLRCIDPVEILQIDADIGEPVLHRFCWRLSPGAS